MSRGKKPRSLDDSGQLRVIRPATYERALYMRAALSLGGEEAYRVSSRRVMRRELVEREISLWAGVMRSSSVTSTETTSDQSTSVWRIDALALVSLPPVRTLWRGSHRTPDFRISSAPWEIKQTGGSIG